MTTNLEPGSREWYLAKPDSELAHPRSWYEADGVSTAAVLPPVQRVTRRLLAALTAVTPAAIFPPQAPLGYLLDWSGARLTDAQLVVAVNTGARAASRYIAPAIASTAWKRIMVPERDQILSKMDLWLNFEWYAGRCLEGAAAGDADGVTINAELTRLAYPSGRVCPVSHDTGTINDPAVQAYFTAVRKRVDAKWGITCYGSYHTVTTLVNAKLCLPVAWQTKAWSGTQLAPKTVISNFQNTNQWFSGTVDENVIMAWPFGAWKSPYPPPPAPIGITGGGDVILRFVNSGLPANQNMFMVTGGQLIYLDVLTVNWIVMNKTPVLGLDRRSVLWQLPIHPNSLPDPR